MPSTVSTALPGGEQRAARRPGDVEEVDAESARAVPGHAVDARVAVVARPRPPGSARGRRRGCRCCPSRCGPAWRHRGAATRPLLDRERPDAGQDVAAVLRVATPRLDPATPAGRDSRRRRRRARDALTTATLQVSGCAAAHAVDLRAGRGSPWRRAGPRRASARSAGRSPARKNSALRRAAAHDDARGSAVWLTRPPVSRRSGGPWLGEPARACRRCRGRARRRRGVRAWRPRSPRACRAASSTAAASLARHDDHAVVVGDDHVARAHERAGADDRHVDRCPASPSPCPGPRSPWTRPGSPSRSASRTSRTPASMTSPRTPCAPARCGEQVAEVAVVAGAGRGDDQDVAGPGTARPRHGSSSCRRARPCR